MNYSIWEDVEGSARGSNRQKGMACIDKSASVGNEKAKEEGHIM